MATRPYEGVVQDARFYVAEALRLIFPGRFDEDFYFRSGSQGNFTLFPLLYAFVIKTLWIGNAAFLLTVAFECCWVGGLCFFSTGLFKDGPTRLAAVLAAIVLPGQSVLQGYGEPFLTPRLPAEVLVLWSFGFMVRERKLRSLLLLAAALAVHPLTSQAGVAVLALREALRKPWWWAVYLVLALAGLGAALLGLEPFARLLDRFDPAWFAVVRIRNGLCLLTQWDPRLWIKLGTTILLWGVGFAFAEPRERRLLLEVVAVASAAFLVTFLGGDILHNVLVVEIQPFRAIWIVSLTGNMFAGAVLLRAWRQGASPLTRIFLACACVSLVFASLVPPALVAATPMMAAAGLALVLERGRPLSLPVRLGVSVLFGLAVGVLVLAVFQFGGLAAAWPAKFHEALRGMALCAASAGILAVLAFATPRRALLASLLVASAALAGIAAASQDWRTSWSRFVESTPVAPDSLTALLPQDGQVYWEGDIKIPWLVLSRPSYFSCIQGAGVLFFRQTALDFQRRYDSFLPLGTDDFESDPYCRPYPARRLPPPTRETLRAICRDNPRLGALVLLHPVAGVPDRPWVAPIEDSFATVTGGKLREVRTDTFHIYACKSL